MRDKMLVILLVVLLCAALSTGVFSAEKSAKPQAAKPAAKAAAFDQQAALEKFWKAPDTAVVGSVDGVGVTKGELMKTLWFWNAGSVLQEMLNARMVEQAAKKAKVTLTPQELQAKIQESLKRMGMTSVDQLINQFRITKDRFMSGTKLSALAEKTVKKDLKVTDAEYAQWVKARHILIKFPPEEKDKTKQDEIAKKKIDEIVQKLKEGADFATLAKENSEDTATAVNGGDLGWFTRGRMVQEFEKAAFEMKPGQISEPVKTFYGYHIIQVEKLGKDASPAEKQELNKQIMEKQVPMKLQEWFIGLQSRSKLDNKLMAPPPKEPQTQMRPQPMRPSPRPAPAPAPAPAPKPTEQPKDGGEAPPPPPPAQ